MKALALAFVLSLLASPAQAWEPWLYLPPTPMLPKPDASGLAPVDGIKLWYAVFGAKHPATVLLLHGGLALLDTLHIERAAVVGWSDGAITGLEIAIHHPERLTGLFAFAANSDPSGVKDVQASPVFKAFIARAGAEYARLSPTPDGYKAFDADIEKMWAREPNMSAATLRGIHARVWIVDADHDEAIKRENTDYMAATIPGAFELILPGVSHFAFLQDPTMFAFAVDHFLN
jgi:pimeloyl-ACP methyl ester carboxylesterase